MYYARGNAMFSTCLTDISAAGRCLASEVSRDIASCAVLTVFPPGVFITMMPKIHQQNCNGEYFGVYSFVLMFLQFVVMHYMQRILPCFVAAATSILSTPTPARPTMRICTACFNTSAFTFVAERTTRPSYSPIIYTCKQQENG